MWFRRDLRLADNPALLSAVSEAADSHVVPLFVLDPALWHPAGQVRRAYLAASLRDLGTGVGGLQMRRGDPVQEVVAVARAAQATTVHITEDFGPHGRARDLDVEAALVRHGIALVRSGSPYAVPPGAVLTKTGSPYQVFTPYSRAWHEHGWPYFVVMLTAGTLRIHDGANVTDVPLALGQSYMRSAGIRHDVMNGSPHPISFVEIEVKQPAHLAEMMA